MEENVSGCFFLNTVYIIILLFHANLVRTTVFQRSHNHLRFCCAATLMTQNHCGVSDSATVNDFVSKL